MAGSIFGLPLRPTSGQGVIWQETLGGRMDAGSLGQAASGLSGLTLNRVPFGNSLGGLQDSANLTFDGTTLALTGAATISTTLGVTGLSTLTGGLTTPAAITSTLATGTAPFTATSTTACPNLNASLLLGGTWAVPGTIGSTTANTGKFTTLQATSTSTLVDVNASGDIACTSNNITLVRSTAGGTVFSARNDDTTSSTSVEFDVIGTTTGGAGRNAVRIVHQANLAGGNAAYLLQSGKVSALLFEDAATVINQREGGPLIFGINDTEVARLSGAVASGSLAVAFTTASTSTSTGAVVIGNGTTGGLGVGGAINAGGNVTATAASPFIIAAMSVAAGGGFKVVNNAGTKYNWIFASQFNVDNGFEITPSTATGGSTFSSPAIQVAGASGGDVAIGSGRAFKLGNAYVATPPTCTGYVTVKDSAGTTYKIMVST